MQKSVSKKKLLILPQASEILNVAVTKNHKKIKFLEIKIYLHYKQFYIGNADHILIIRIFLKLKNDF